MPCACVPLVARVYRYSRATSLVFPQPARGCRSAPSGIPVQRHRGEPGHTRDRHKNLTNQPQNQPHPPTHAPDQPHTRRNPGTHASPHTTPLTRKRGGGDGDGDGARTWEQRGREPDGIGDGTPPRTGRRGGKRLFLRLFGIRERLIALTVHARRQGPGMITRDAPLAKQKTEGLMA